MQKIIFGMKPKRMLPLLFLLAAVVLPMNLRAQESSTGTYTLTNGTHMWLEGPEGSEHETDVLLRNDCYGEAIHGNTPVNLHTHIGDYYLALDLSDPNNPTIVNVPTSTGFSRYCVWNRTGITGYYYQEWDNYRYYIIGTRNSLRIEKVEVGASTAYFSKFFNWDFGAAITDITYRNGVRHEAYYWIMFDTVGTDNTPANGVWRMSGDTYSRPESRILRSDLSETYCDAIVGHIDGHDTTWIPAGQGAIYLPVNATYHDMSVNFPAGQGLTGLSLDKTVLKYGDQLVATPTLSVPGTVPVTLGYYEFVEETDRYGMNSDYRYRSDPGYGSAGTPTTRTYYYWDNAPTTRQSSAPTPVNRSVSVVKKEYDITPSALRWVDTATVGDNFQVHCNNVPNRGTSGWIYLTVTYNNGVEQRDSVHFDFSIEVTTPPFPEPKNAPVVKGYVVGGGRIANVSGNTSVTVHSTDSLYALYGGNDIAGWVQGANGATIQLGTAKTNATHPVHIGYAYGGGCGYYTYQGINPGLVKASDGVTDSLVDSYIHNGHETSLEYQAYFFNGKVYKWNSLPNDYATYAAQAIEHGDHTYLAGAAWDDSKLVADVEFKYRPQYLCDGTYDPIQVDATENGNGGSCMTDKQYLGTVPYIKTAHITVGVPIESFFPANYNELSAADKLTAELAAVNSAKAYNDNILIDSLFGGAENAFIGVTSNELSHPENAVTIDIHGGTIYAVFGGNNYGGSVANTSTVFVNVHDTKTTPTKNIQNTYFTGYGREYGIRYLFGGGNLVDGSHANVTINGGMIDTCYLGGNMAEVIRPLGTVNCTGGRYIFDNDSITKQWEGGVLVDKPLYNPSAGAGHEWDNYDSLVNSNPDRFNAEIGRYNIRVLFGGSNKAAMNTISQINLLSGGISSVYGGGNAGDMRYGEPTTSLPRWVQDSSVVGFTGWKYQRPRVISTIVHSEPRSRIMVEYIYGGCRMANVKGSTILWLSGGVFGYAHGGNDISGDVGSEINEGSYAVIDRKAVVLQDVYGGSDGYYHCSDKNGRYMEGYALRDANDEAYDPYDEYVGQLVPTHNNTNLYLNGGKVLYSAYGGGVKAHVGFAQEVSPKINVRDSNYVRDLKHDIQKGSIHVQMNGNTVVGSKVYSGFGNAYGGGYLSYLYGCGYATVGGNTEILGSLYAGNDCMGSLNSFAAYSIPEVRDPDNNVVVSAVSEADFQASDGSPLNYLSGSEYNALYSTYLLIEDTPKINCVYGSGNGDYDYTDKSNLGVGPVCHFEYSEVTPLQESVFIDINTESGSMIDTVFGGGNGVGVMNNVEILFNSKNPDILTVGTIFGGNNQENMESCVPDIILKKGTVKNVFGGGNSGSMNGSDNFTDVCGEDVDGVSTYVLVNTDQVTIQDSLFGGCRKADVRGMAYIDIRNTQAGGINYVYGGNDISGSINGNTRIDVSGGKVNNIYGGSNGRYDYTFLGNDDFAVYAYASDHSDPANLISEHSSGSPFVDSTTVHLYGGIIDNNVYGGGSMGDCRATFVDVNDRVCPAKLTADLTINGAVYGGGEGDWEHLQRPHRGNVAKPEHSDGVEGGTYVHLHHASNLSSATAYGGGRGGDVENSNIIVLDTWDQPFDAIYGGCWGSHVLGTATLTMQGADFGGAQNAFQVFGGNDYTGNVFRSVLNIESGKYGSIYGAGNGDYDYTVQPVAGHTIWIPSRNTLPNTEFVEINFLDGHVDSNLFGGGLMGTTWRMKTNDLGEHIYNPVDEGPAGIVNYRIPDTNVTKANAYDDPMGYSFIVVNVHGGVFDNNIYAGASGKTDQLVFGLKVLNMDGGDVKESVYGGSQRVNDGYPAECQGLTAAEEASHVDPMTKTTLRPSSILNIAGGIITASVYGAGYQGNTYGSVYVNIGANAIENSKVWNRTIAGADDAYAIFKPGATGSLSPALTPNHVILNTSIYGGANWGNNSGSFDFRQPGFFGGESRIYVDGMDYNTQGSSTSTLPMMDIANSIIGSGTSVQGGDVHNSIHVYNYGAVDFGSCHATKTLRSIQRADELVLWNTAIFYDGATDAASAYPSQQLTINRVDTVKVRGYNVMDLNAVMTEVGQLHFYEDALDGSGNLVHTQNQDLIINDANQCRNDIQVCDRLQVIDPVTNKYAAMVVNNGVNVDIMTTDGGYGFVEGFGYLFAETGTNAVVTARAKYQGHNLSDGGFMSSCSDSNLVVTAMSGTTVTWDNCATAGINCNLAEYPYHNFRESYRVWSVGQGKRTRFAVLLAHAQPELLPQDDKYVKLYDGDAGKNYSLALAHAELVLPPTTPGHYYRLGADGVTIEDDNATLRFVDKTWHPVSWSSVGADSSVAQANPGEGTWEELHLSSGSSASDLRGVDLIMDDPATTFGLMMTSGRNFASTSPNTYTAPETYTAGNWNQGGTALSGNNHVNIIQHFYSAQVGADVNASPVMDLYLTYSTEFSSTMLGTVYFTLDEYKAVPMRANYDGNDISTNHGPIVSPTVMIDSNLNQPINVAVTISTLLEKFKDMEYDLLAMYNEGRSNTFVRKAVLPATLHARELYLDSITWMPKDCNNTDFYLTGDPDEVMNDPDPNVFCVGVQPMDNISSSLTSTVGWHIISQDTVVDIFSTAMPYTGDNYSDQEQFSKAAASSATCNAPDKIGLNGQGLRIGELDGRGLAALNISLTYDGNKVYPDGVVGHLDLHFSAYNPADTSKFNIRVNVKCRTAGDTIYLASAPSITRCSTTLTPGSLADVDPGNTQKIGKRPAKYLTNFMQVFDASIYQEGDVIAVLDTVKITDAVSIRGVDYASVPIVRYSGHHHDLEGECGVFRGTMFDVSTEDGVFSTSFIDFCGSDVSRISGVATSATYPEYWNATLNPAANDPTKHLDTNEAFGPIIAVHNGGTVSLGSGSTLHSNYNGYDGSDVKRRGGAISVTAGGNLILTNNVTIENNLVPAETGDHPTSGAVYVDGGNVTLNPSHKSTAVTITDNYIYDGSAPYWMNYKNAQDKLVRFTFDTNYATNALKRNLFLTRLPGTPDIDTNDSQTDVIDMVSVLPENTKIGISKWFPGPDVRDTIRFAYGHKFTDLLQATHTNSNFVSDEGYNIFYEYNVENLNIFLHRCATFRHQLAGVDLPYDNNGTLLSGDVLSYLPLMSATCPTGGDAIVYRIQGGFFPYTYTWSGSSSKTRTTEVVNNTLMAQVNEGNYDNYINAISDTLYTPHVSMTPHEFSENLTYTVEAQDVSGFCTLKKDISVTLIKSAVDNPERFEVINDGGQNGWVDTNRSVRALGNRNYKAIRITPRVWVDRSAGTISAYLPGDDYVYQEVADVSPLTGDDTIYQHELENLLFCEGDIIRLSTNPRGGSASKFLMWDFDPYYSQTASYVVPSRNSDVVAYYGPSNYWKDQVNSESVAHAVHDANYDYTTRTLAGDAAAGYVTTYNGDVHIYNENGLAWLISVVNGYNGQQLRPFYFNKIFIHQKDDGTPYDMKDYLWTPVGTQQYGFRGRFIGVGKPSVVSDSSTVPLANPEQVVIRNIIVSEPALYQVGFFGNLDTAMISGIKLEAVFARGGHYVGGMAGQSAYSRIDNCAVSDERENESTATILTTHYVSGGFIGRSLHDSITNTSAAAKFVGDAVYSGGVIGHGTSSSVSNSGVMNITRMTGLYIGGLAGYLDGEAPVSRGFFRRKSAGSPSVVANNYVRLLGESKGMQRIGGIVGYAENVVLENNYAYGQFRKADVHGGVAGALNTNADAHNNYYAASDASRAVGVTAASASTSDNVAFRGKGNRVTIDQPVYGVNNLTRVLNRWVRENNAAGGEYKTWRSDLENVHDGYPLFGQPDVIPVSDTLMVDGCDQVEYQGILYNEDTEFAYSIIDSIEMVDSTVITLIRLHHSTSTLLTDTALLGEDYNGYGFYVSSTESALLRRSLDSTGNVTLVLTDTLQTTFGCDSIITLTLTFHSNGGSEDIVEVATSTDVKVYPNPTVNIVNVEAEQISRVEVYDNEGRRLQYYDAYGNNKITIDMTPYVTGVYFVRVHMPESVVIQKIIKER